MGQLPTALAQQGTAALPQRHALLSAHQASVRQNITRWTDALALILATIAFYVQSRPANDVKTFGYHRAGVLAGALAAFAVS